MARLRVGLIVNPWAGIGGPAALKGSDAKSAVEIALAEGFEPRAGQRVVQCLSMIEDASNQIEFVTAAGQMGADLCAQTNCRLEIIGAAAHEPSTPADTRALSQQIVAAGVDVLLFGGGDGTARDILDAIGTRVPVLGVPAGVKMHSGVFAVSPSAAAIVLNAMVQGRLVEVRDAEVRDIDEAAFAKGTVKSRYYGEMRVVQFEDYVQAVKQGGQAGDEQQLHDLAEYLAEWLDPNKAYVMGCGSTVHTVGEVLGLDLTLLGVDLIQRGEVIGCDLSEKQLWEHLSKLPAEELGGLIVTAIGGQGHIIGRGNQQISARTLRYIGKERCFVVATEQKLFSLAGAPLRMDSGDLALDQEWKGWIEVIHGYRQRGLYPLAI